MTPSSGLDRRSYLRASAATMVTLTAGCTALDPRDDGDDHLILGQPDQYDMLREARDGGDLAHPIYGDELPDATVPCTLHEREVSTAEFEGERHTLFTFIFARCHAACPGLTASLRHVQDDSVDGDYEDRIALCNVTFDPEHDTPAVLEEYGDGLGVDYELDNWHFLRPESEADARAVVEEQFGCYFARNEDYEGEGGGHGHGDGDGNGAGDHADEHDDGENGDSMEMAFEHASMIVLANADGYVERTYTGARLPSSRDLVDDVRTVVEGWDGGD
ncbi:SCO family protein [Halobacteria archaeon AArc-m2/3/4]|uniref:SCO family protein n=1 Tax=Natronoglomus mannanivorans TaxID=2979990 RepID=A0ABT2QLC2_9EURY|nr:SCO family protein [Halobacteria archaeon AArc-m2/3/4]